MAKRRRSSSSGDGFFGVLILLGLVVVLIQQYWPVILAVGGVGALIYYGVKSASNSSGSNSASYPSASTISSSTTPSTSIRQESNMQRNSVLNSNQNTTLPQVRGFNGDDFACAEINRKIRSVFTRRKELLTRIEQINKAIIVWENGVKKNPDKAASILSMLKKEKASTEGRLNAAVYSFKETASPVYDELTAALKQLTTENAQTHDNTPDNKGIIASYKPIGEMKYIHFSVEPLCLSLGTDLLCILPSYIVVFSKQGDFKCVYSCNAFGARTTDFSYQEQVRRVTWDYTRMDGGPDLRYKNNRMHEYFTPETRTAHDVLELSVVNYRLSYDLPYSYSVKSRIVAAVKAYAAIAPVKAYDQAYHLVRLLEACDSENKNVKRIKSIIDGDEGQKIDFPALMDLAKRESVEDKPKQKPASKNNIEKANEKQKSQVSVSSNLPKLERSRRIPVIVVGVMIGILILFCIILIVPTKQDSARETVLVTAEPTIDLTSTPKVTSSPKVTSTPKVTPTTKTVTTTAPSSTAVVLDPAEQTDDAILIAPTKQDYAQDTVPETSESTVNVVSTPDLAPTTTTMPTTVPSSTTVDLAPTVQPGGETFMPQLTTTSDLSMDEESSDTTEQSDSKGWDETDGLISSDKSRDEVEDKTIIRSLLPNKALWGITQEEFLKKDPSAYTECEIGNKPGLLTTGIKVGTYTMDRYYVFGNQTKGSNSNNYQGLSKITYVLSYSDPSINDLKRCLEDLSAAMKKEVGDPDSESKNVTTWITKEYKIEIGRAKVPKYTGLDESTIIVIFSEPAS